MPAMTAVSSLSSLFSLFCKICSKINSCLHSASKSLASSGIRRLFNLDTKALQFSSGFCFSCNNFFFKAARS
ncbi:hypothetical protein OUZ56_018815 [Daphnia magna]|uniref:Secreted protein n=1 Tax=Daphnia magna TaxID=35525 RepID=A0ABQ9ZAL4_9CRUS|nr:hypothetical protein OUZ56_018815 [Daphnia magna]